MRKTLIVIGSILAAVSFTVAMVTFVQYSLTQDAKQDAAYRQVVVQSYRIQMQAERTQAETTAFLCAHGRTSSVGSCPVKY